MTPARNAIVDARAIHKQFGAPEVLKGIDLVVAERELVSSSGPRARARRPSCAASTGSRSRPRASIVIDGVDLLHPKTDINAMTPAHRDGPCRR